MPPAKVGTGHRRPECEGGRRARKWDADAPKLPLPASAGEDAQPEPRGSRLQRGHMLEPSQRRSEKVSKQALREAFLKSP